MHNLGLPGGRAALGRRDMSASEANGIVLMTASLLRHNVLFGLCAALVGAAGFPLPAPAEASAPRQSAQVQTGADLSPWDRQKDVIAKQADAWFEKRNLCRNRKAPANAADRHCSVEAARVSGTRSPGTLERPRRWDSGPPRWGYLMNEFLARVIDPQGCQPSVVFYSGGPNRRRSWKC
jgi:hypothetical protein